MKKSIKIVMSIIFSLLMIAPIASSIGTGLMEPRGLPPNSYIISDENYAGYGKLIDTENPLESNMLQYKKTIINGSIMDIDDGGNIFFGSGNKKLYKTSDGGKTSILLHTFSNTVTSVYYYKSAKFLFVGCDNGNIYRSTDNGKTWTSVLKMPSGNYPIWWSWDSDSSKILVGGYGQQSNGALVYKSIDKGKTWTTFFDLKNYYSVTDNNAHLHLVKIDPYNNNRVFITVGDSEFYRGLYITENNGASFDQTPVVQFGNFVDPANGFLGAVFPDANNVIFFTDCTPDVWQYNKISKEAKKLAEFPNPYFSRETKFYDAVMGKYGVIYATAIDYTDDLTNFISISIDGKVWYKLNGAYQNIEDGNIPLRYNPIDGYIYAGTGSPGGKGVAFKDLTKAQAAKLLNVQIIEDNNSVNYVKNPSFEAGNPPTSWTLGKPARSTLSRDCTTSRYDKCSAKISKSTWSSYQYITENTNFNLLGQNTYVVRFSYKLSAFSNIRGPVLDVIYDSNSGSNMEAAFFADQYAKNWSDAVYYWTPSEDITVKSVSIYMYDKIPTYWFDGISISKAPYN